MPKKVRFDLEDCASMSFVITVAGNVYLGGLEMTENCFLMKQYWIGLSLT